MKNKLSDLNDHLFAQMERLADEGLTPDKIEQEVKRGSAMVSVADVIIRNGQLQLDAARLLVRDGEKILPHLPLIGSRQA